jgi:hypothetical protein
MAILSRKFVSVDLIPVTTSMLITLKVIHSYRLP